MPGLYFQVYLPERTRQERAGDTQSTRPPGESAGRQRASIEASPTHPLNAPYGLSQVLCFSAWWSRCSRATGQGLLLTFPGLNMQDFRNGGNHRFHPKATLSWVSCHITNHTLLTWSIFGNSQTQEARRWV